jgi:DNA-binding CsgD family transcriptional regulator
MTYTNQEIADELNYSIHYVKQHVVMLRDKMGAGSRLQAAVKWVREQERAA